MPLPTFSQDRPNATRAAERATTHRTPYDVLTKADKVWRKTHGHALFNGSYLSQSPSIWANQCIGLAAITHSANHINTSLTKYNPAEMVQVAMMVHSQVILCHRRCLIGIFTTARRGILPTNTVKMIWLINCSMWKVLFSDLP